MFLEYKAKHNKCQSRCKLMNDVMNHGTHPTWKQYLDGDNLPTGSHEGTHFVNSELRMMREGRFESYENIEDTVDIKPVYMITGEERIIAKDEFGHVLWAPVNRGWTGPKFNAFYLGNDKYVKLNEPPIRKSNVAQFVPQSMRSFRFSTYITGQTAWDDTPLYIYDEWVAYCIGVEAALELNKAGGNDGKGTDQPHGPLEFTIYSVALCMALRKLAPDYLTEEKDFKPFTLWNMIRAFNLYHYAMEKFPWPDSNRLIGVLRRDTNYTDFLKSEFNFTVPDGPIEGKEIDAKLFNIYRTS